MRIRKRCSVYNNHLQETGAAAAKAAETFGGLVLLKAFANGCSAMTGTEAVSNGIPAFQGTQIQQRRT